MKKYYCNQECEILAELPNDKVVIELETHTWSTPDTSYEPGCTEPYFSTIIVDKKYISDKKIDIEKEFREKEEALELKRQKIEHEMYQKSWKIDEELKKLTKTLTERVKRYKGLEQYLYFLDGKYKYVVAGDNYSSWYIKKLDELYCNCDSKELASVQFRSEKRKEYNDWEECAMYIGQYSDSSGSKYRVKGFETLEEAIEEIKRKIDKEKEDDLHYYSSTCKEYNISHPKMDKYLEERRKRDIEYYTKEVLIKKRDLENYQSKLEELKK